MAAVESVIINGVTYVPKRAQETAEPEYLELAKKLLAAPRVLEALAITLREEGQ